MKYQDYIIRRKLIIATKEEKPTYGYRRITALLRIRFPQERISQYFVRKVLKLRRSKP